MTMIKTQRISIARLSAAGLSVLLAGPALAAPCEVEGGRIQAALTANASTMDPILSTTNASRQVAVHLFESLASMDSNYQVIPQLAQDWSRSEDGLAYTFRLRPGVKFHNGKTMTAEDVKASLDRFLKISPGANRFKNVKSVEIVDPMTVRIVLTADFPLLNNLAMPSPIVAIFPKEIVDRYGDKEVRGEDVIGTGPYRLKEWRPDVGVKMTKFSDYAADARYSGPMGFGGARTPCADEVDFLPVTEDASRVAGLQTGDFDFAEAVPITSVPSFESDPAIAIEILKPKWAIVLELDHKNPLMQKLAFRKALLAALNMEQVMRASAFGRPDYFRVQPSIFFPEQTQWTTEAGSDGYNKPDKARVAALLKEAGYANEPVIYLTNQNYGWMYKASQAIAAQWQAAGINAKLEVMDWPSQIKRAQTSSDWAINQSGWSPRFDPFQTIDSFKCGSVSAFGYCNPAMEAALARVNSGAGLEERQKAWQAAQKQAWEDLAVLRIGDYFEPEATRRTLRGYVPFYTTPRFWNVSQTRK
jgi:peptide/nickel transport system substrate-binding protein